MPPDITPLRARRQSIRALPSPDTLLRSAGAYANHALGQHFLTDTAVTDDIVYQHGPLQGKHVIEIGPGAGTLTRSLLCQDIASLTVIEKDKRFADMMRDIYAPAAGGIMRVIEGDALDLSLYIPDTLADDVQKSGGMHIVANLPYNIGTELVARWLKYGHMIEALSVMLQKETAERFAAPAGSRKYGRLSVLAALYSDADISLYIPPERFNPPPKVDSAILRMRLSDRPRYDVEDTTHIERLAKHLFSSRRQTVRRSFKRLAADKAEHLLQQAGIDPAIRPEHITPQQFVLLADLYQKASAAPEKP